MINSKAGGDMETILGEINFENITPPGRVWEIEPSWSVRITRVSNGYLIETPDGIKLIECDGLEKDTMTSLLEYVAEYFRTQETEYSKFRKDNLRITWDRWGSKAE